LSPRERSNLPVPASIRQRLLNHAWEHREEFQLVLTWYAIERLLYRLSRSPHANTFVLKGALLFAIWSRESHRATRDLDLLGTGDPRVSTMEEIFREVCRVPCEDGLELDPPSVRGEEIRGADEYDGRAPEPLAARRPGGHGADWWNSSHRNAVAAATHGGARRRAAAESGPGHNALIGIRFWMSPHAGGKRSQPRRNHQVTGSNPAVGSVEFPFGAGG
jgi:hypothetical protein